ncbi:gluconokinase [Thalassotalea profundi]|uniref:Gluconokinase n=1 Tax=Thalassotalea profundi TaxID=2036687 RepID=A0ABQ3IKE3_9GAMM|nr:gluconokinase, GntK/IdnK-type [Thalassotalea profundi]GHE83420.1 gluconokinase [Thalassotalea profundi]
MSDNVKRSAHQNKLFHETKPRLIIVMGVSGSGKSTVALQVASGLDFTFLDADDFHTPEAKQCMSQNIPLTDEMRKPWIESLCFSLIQYQQSQTSVVLAFSGLKAMYRKPFRTLGFSSTFILLNGCESLIAKRLEARQNHFANKALLASQFDTLELPLDTEKDIVTLDVSLSVNRLAHSIINIVRKDNSK